MNLRPKVAAFRRVPAFTLIELLVVIAIIGLLAGLLLGLDLTVGWQRKALRALGRLVVMSVLVAVQRRSMLSCT